MRTPQELRELADELFVEDGWPTAKLVIAAGAFREYADALERAQAGITDEVVKAAFFGYTRSLATQFDARGPGFNRLPAMRAALESVWPLQAKDAQAGITDTVVDRAVHEFNKTESLRGAGLLHAMRAALESVWPLQAKDAQAIHAAMVRDNDEIAMQGDLAEELLAARQTLERVRALPEKWRLRAYPYFTAVSVAAADLESALKEPQS